MLKHTLNEMMNQTTNYMAKQLGLTLSRILIEKLSGAAVHRLKSECAALIRNASREAEPSTSSTPAQQEPAAASTGRPLI